MDSITSRGKCYLPLLMNAAVITLTFSVKVNQNGRQLFYIYSVTADGIGSLALIAYYFGKE